MPNATLATAIYLTDRPGGSTREDLCAAVSTTYYALFETIAKLSADLFVGLSSSDRADRAWRHVYRSHDHTRIATKCASQRMHEFPQAIIDFSELFLQLQYKRHLSDYEHEHSPNLGEVITDISRAEVRIEAFLQSDEKHQRAYCVFVLFEKHRHEEKERLIPRRQA